MNNHFFKSSALIILWRHFLSGRLNILLAAFIIATASLSAITLISGSIYNTIINQARYSLAGDAQIRGSKPIPETWITSAQNNGLEYTTATQFRAMAFSADANVLTSVKAVAPPYPLLGALVISDIPYGESRPSTTGPRPGEAWLSPRLFAALNIRPGDSIDIGEQHFIAKTSLVTEPDSMQSVFNMAPRIMIHSDDVTATGAIQLGSRVEYALMIKGSKANLARFKSDLNLDVGYRWLNIEESNERVGSTLKKATQFIHLGGILSIILAAIGIAVATRSYVGEQIPQVALLKTLGATPRRIIQLYSLHISLLALVGTMIGLLLGLIIYALIKVSLTALIADLVAPDFGDVLFAATLSISIFIVFAAPYFYRLRNISPLRVLQQTHNADLLNNWVSLILGCLAAFILSVAFSRDLTLTAYFYCGLLVSCGLAALCSIGMIYLAGKLTRKASPNLRLGIGNLIRHRMHNAPHIMMFSLLFMLLFTLIMIRTSLINSWQAQLPANAPNHFIYNIFDNQKQLILDTLKQHQIETSPSYPIFGGRLTEINHQPAKEVMEKAKNRVNYEREFGLTWSHQPGSDNKIVSGKWWGTEEKTLLVSVEETFAKGLQLKTGDSLTFAIDGIYVDATVSNIRTVRWDSMNLNFYLIFNQPPTDALNANWATSFFLEAGRKDVINQIARANPTLSIIELDQTIQQIKGIVNRVSLSIELITLLVLGSGCVILIASIQSTYRTRVQESAILRTFGASKRTVQQLNFIEFGAIGLASGMLATLGTEAVLFFIGNRILDNAPLVHWPLWAFGPITVTLIILALTSGITRKMHQQTPMKILQSL